LLDEVKEEVRQEIKEVKRKKVSATTIIIVLLSLIIVCGVGGGFWYYQDQQNIKKQAELQAIAEAKAAAQAIKDYHDSIDDVSRQIYNFAAESQNVLAKYSEVWHDAIFDKKVTINGQARYNSAYDFNDAITFKKEELSADIVVIQANVETAKKSLKDLKNPPEGYSEAYNAVMELFDAANEMATQTQSPSGSLIEFNKNINALIADVKTYYDKFNLVLPELRLKT
jgi:hypothetical protein